MTDPEGSFDVVLLGTGLAQSITAAALAKAGFKVAHIDPLPYYGSAQASLSLDELVDWAKSNGHTVRTRDHDSSAGIPLSRQYSASLLPSVIPSIGPLISALVASGVARYGGFKLLERVAVYGQDGSLKNVPGSKEDIFKDTAIRLLDKRRLMKFLTFCISEGSLEDKPEVQDKTQQPFVEFLKSTFSLNSEMADAVAYALAFSSSATEPTLPALLRIQHYLRSAGRYGPSPFLLGHYGSLGEIAQGFCRTAAVSGAVYILGRDITSLSLSSSHPDAGKLGRKYAINISDFPETMGADVIISSDLPMLSGFLDKSGLPTPPACQKQLIARAIAIIDTPFSFPSIESSTSSEEGDEDQDPNTNSPQVDTGIVVFPPGSISSGSSDAAATALFTGEGSMSAPSGKTIVYISLPLLSASTTSVEEILKPYLDALLTSATTSSLNATEPILSIFYTDESLTATSEASSSSEASTILVVPSFETHPFPAPPDEAAKTAEQVFWKAVKILQQHSQAGHNETQEEITEMWPPLDSVGDDD